MKRTLSLVRQQPWRRKLARTAGAVALSTAVLVIGAVDAGAVGHGQVSVSATRVPASLVPAQAYRLPCRPPTPGHSSSLATSVKISLPPR